VAAGEALARLRAGNRRYTHNLLSIESLLSHNHRGDPDDRRKPFAIVLGCSDSRAPAEIVFDQGLGDLFVIRVAGNIAAASQIGSIEFAAQHFGCRLVVVLGHTGCGAIDATIASMTSDLGPSGHLTSIVSRVRPAVEPLMPLEVGSLPDLRRRATTANVLAAVRQIRRGSELIQTLAAAEGLAVVGAELSLETGAVTFYDDASH
jgi:carbonic anhydrase